MRIAIVNDSTMAVEALRRVLHESGEHQLAWIACNGCEAVERCAQDTPDLILMDLMMPAMDGVAATRRIMAQSPCAILIVTAGVDTYAAKVFEALGAGALDVVSTPVRGSDGAAGGAEALLAKIHVLRHFIRGEKRQEIPARQAKPSTLSQYEPLIVIGASAGGPAALATILSELPSDFSGAIVIVQHVDVQFAGSMANWLNDQSTIPVRTAREGERPRVGTALLAESSDHLIFSDARTLHYTPDPTNCVYRPSVDIFFESVAHLWKAHAAGVLLTGMGRDGARGLKILRDTGALTITQNRESCVVYGMPKAAIALDAAVEVLPLHAIAPRLVEFCNQLTGSRANN